VPQIGDLEQEEGKPGNSQQASKNWENLLPVEGSNESIEGKWGRESCVVTPDGISPVLSVIRRRVEGVVYTREHREKPCYDGQHLVDPDSLNVVGLASRKGICFRTSVMA